MLLQLVEPGTTPDPHSSSEKIAIGIDLGTTNSVIAFAKDGDVSILGDETLGKLIPSIVTYANNDVVVGVEMPNSTYRNTVSSVKRFMGRTHDEVLKEGAHHLMIKENDGIVVFDLEDRARNPVEVSADILRYLKKQAEQNLKQDIHDAVITVPAHFDDAARAATKDAAKLAGLNVLRLLNEPTAAALAYGLDHGVEGVIAVYDLGGGTFDLSLLRLRQGVFQVLATGGDVCLGGDDLDRALLDIIVQKHGNLDDAFWQTLSFKNQAKSLKEKLSNDDSCSVLLQGKEVTITRTEFENAITPFLEKTIEITKRVLLDAKVHFDEVKGVVLVGGSTRIPLLQRMVEAEFGKKPLCDIDPDEAVARGAALQAEALCHKTDRLLLDVNPLSLGIETMGGLVEKIIPRNTPLPTRQEKEYTTFKDGQTAMKIHVVQGERELVSQCRSLANFELHNIPPMVAGAARIKVIFCVDADGLLEVEACEMITGVSQNIVVKPSYGLSQEKLLEMLHEANMFGADDMKERLLIASRIEAQRLYEALESALLNDRDLLSEIEFFEINEAIIALKETIKGNDKQLIDAQMKVLEALSLSFAERRLTKHLAR